MTVKIGDFGLSIRFDENVKQTTGVCGTPNYVSPEILDKNGHSVSSEIWSIGCMVYALLCGRPPFDSESIVTTYSRIKTIDYSIPSNLSVEAREFIKKLLDKDPGRRGSLEEGDDSLLDHSFISSGFTPTSLPPSAVFEPPVWVQPPVDLSMEESIPPSGTFLERVSQQLTSFMVREDSDSDDPGGLRKEVPVFINKWVDYSNNFGFVCQLSDGNVAVLFNDSRKLGVAPEGKCVEFEDEEGKVIFSSPDQNHNLQQSRDLQGMYQQLERFIKYMEEALNDTVVSDSMTRVVVPCQSTKIPQIKRWVRKEDMVMVVLSCNLVQINFLVEHVKVVLWSKEEEDLRVTVITSKDRDSRAITLSLLSDRAQDLTVPLRELLWRVVVEISDLSQDNRSLE